MHRRRVSGRQRRQRQLDHGHGGEQLRPGRFWSLYARFGYDADSDEAIDYQVDQDLNDDTPGVVRDVQITLSLFTAVSDPHPHPADEVCAVQVTQPGPLAPVDLGDEHMVRAFELDWDKATVTYTQGGVETQTCGNLDPAVWGGDLAASLATVSWGVGLTGQADPGLAGLGDPSKMFGVRLWLSSVGSLLSPTGGETSFATAAALDSTLDPPEVKWDDQNDNGIWDASEPADELSAPTDWTGWTPPTAAWKTTGPVQDTPAAPDVFIADR